MGICVCLPLFCPFLPRELADFFLIPILFALFLLCMKFPDNSGIERERPFPFCFLPFLPIFIIALIQLYYNV